MFGNLTHTDLQQYWFIIVSLLGSILVFLFFVQGGQTFIFRIGKSDSERTILVVFSLFLLAGFNNTAFYPSAHDLQSSLTIQNSSSSHYTLVAMSWVSLFIPLVLAYIVIAWRALNKKKIDEKEMEEEHHVY